MIDPNGKRGAVMVLALMLTMFVLPMVSLTASAENVRLYPDYVVLNQLYELSSVDGADASTILTPTSDPGFGSADDDTNKYDGDPGCLYWGNITSGGEGTLGTAYVKIGMTDIVGASSDYWSVDVYLTYELVGGQLPYGAGDSYPDVYSNTLNCSIWVGYSSEGMDGWNNSVTYPGSIGSTYPVGYPQCSGLHYNIFNDDEGGRPWSTDEINDGFVVIKVVLNIVAFNTFDWPVTLCLAYIQCQVQSETYTPPAAPVVPDGSFILYPDTEILNNTFGAYPSTMTDLADATNESTYHSDGDTSYAYGTYSGLIVDSETMTLGFQDPSPGYTFAKQFTVTPWIIARMSTASAVILYSTVYDSTDLANTQLWVGDAVTNSYTNYSSPLALLNPRTNATWTLEDLSNIEMGFQGLGFLCTGQLRISQVALLVSPVWTDSNPWDFSGMLQYLGGGMIPTVIGVLGFAMMIGVPTLAVWSYRNGDNDAFGSAVHAAVLMVLGFGLFLVGLIGT